MTGRWSISTGSGGRRNRTRHPEPDTAAGAGGVNPQGLGVRIEAANASQGFLEAGFFRGTGGFWFKIATGWYF